MEQDARQHPEFWKAQLWWILLPLIMAVAVALLPPWLNDRRVEAERVECANNMRIIGLWLIEYAMDHGGTVPTGLDWVDELGEYVKNREVMICPSAEEDASVSYAPNPGLMDVNFNLLKNPHEVVLLYEAEAGTLTNRHHGGANYLFADRTVEWREEPPESLDVVVAQDP